MDKMQIYRKAKKGKKQSLYSICFIFLHLNTTDHPIKVRDRPIVVKLEWNQCKRAAHTNAIYWFQFLRDCTESVYILSGYYQSLSSLYYWWVWPPSSVSCIPASLPLSPPGSASPSPTLWPSLRVKAVFPAPLARQNAAVAEPVRTDPRQHTHTGESTYTFGESFLFSPSVIDRVALVSLLCFLSQRGEMSVCFLDACSGFFSYLFFPSISL